MRTQAEILEKLIDYYNKPTEDIFIYRTEVLYEFCTLETLQNFISLIESDESITRWNTIELKRENVIEKMKSFYDDAIAAAFEGSGSKSFKAITNLEICLWLLCDDEMVKFFEDKNNYPTYGVPMLKRLASKYREFSFPMNFGVEYADVVHES